MQEAPVGLDVDRLVPRDGDEVGVLHIPQGNPRPLPTGVAERQPTLEVLRIALGIPGQGEAGRVQGA